MKISSWIREIAERFHDPYLNPGRDVVVDQIYHHIDHGLGPADFGHGFNHDFNHDVNHGFGHDFGGMDHF